MPDFFLALEGAMTFSLTYYSECMIQDLAIRWLLAGNCYISIKYSMIDQSFCLTYSALLWQKEASDKSSKNLCCISFYIHFVNDNLLQIHLAVSKLYMIVTYSQTCLSGNLSIAANLPIVTTKLIPMETHYLYKNLYIAATCL